MNADTFWSILVCIQFYDKYEFQNAANCTHKGKAKKHHCMKILHLSEEMNCKFNIKILCISLIYLHQL